MRLRQPPLACPSLTNGHMSGEPASAKVSTRQRSVLQGTVRRLQALARPYLLRVVVDAEAFLGIPGRHGRIEWSGDGVNYPARLKGIGRGRVTNLRSGLDK